MIVAHVQGVVCCSLHLLNTAPSTALGFCSVMSQCSPAGVASVPAPSPLLSMGLESQQPSRSENQHSGLIVQSSILICVCKKKG